jgi:hypothetical protein
MRKLMGMAAVVAACAAPVLALPASASAQSLPALPIPVPTDPSQLPAPPVPLPSLPPLPIPTDAIVNALGQVFDQAGNLLGVVDSVTGLLIPASPTPSPTPTDTGSTPSGSPSGSTSSSSASSVPKKQTPPPVAARPPSSDTATNTAASRDDADAPGLSMLVTHATRYKTARAKGLRVTARCTEACRLTLRLTKGAQYAMLSTTLPANTTTNLKLKLNKGARKVLARSRRATKLTLRGQAVDAAGNHSAIIRRTTIVKAGRR